MGWSSKYGGWFWKKEKWLLIVWIQTWQLLENHLLPVDKNANLPGWWVKKIWLSRDGWLLVAKKNEVSLLIHEAPRTVDQRNLVEETISSEGSIESQRQHKGAQLAQEALHRWLNLPGESLHSRDRSRSPRGDAPMNVTQGDDADTLAPAMWSLHLPEKISSVTSAFYFAVHEFLFYAFLNRRYLPEN